MIQITTQSLSNQLAFDENPIAKHHNHITHSQDLTNSYTHPASVIRTPNSRSCVRSYLLHGPLGAYPDSCRDIPINTNSAQTSRAKNLTSPQTFYDATTSATLRSFPILNLPQSILCFLKDHPFYDGYSRARQPSQELNMCHLNGSSKEALVPLHEVPFNAGYLHRFQVAEQPWKNLPYQLQTCLTGIQYNAAAVLTSIDRFKALRAEAIHRGWPEHSRYLLKQRLLHGPFSKNKFNAKGNPRSHHSATMLTKTISAEAFIPILNAKTSGKTLAAGAARAERAYSKESSSLSDAWGSPMSMGPRANIWPDPNNSAAQSPPESPILCRGTALHPRVRRLTQSVRATASAQPTTVPFRTDIDNVQLEPLTPPQSPAGGADFDEAAWLVYTGNLQAELDFLRRNLLVDLQHRIHGFKKLLYELGEC